MIERPILFSASMVQAILAGNKTQTRRVAKHPLLETLSYIVNIGDGWFGDEEGDVQVRCPYGKVGDQLWVRETWGVISYELDANGNLADWVPDRPATAIHEMPFGNGYYHGHVIYRADGEHDFVDIDTGEEASQWKPSIHMPRIASRIQLEITNIRVERLNDCSDADAIEEGIDRTNTSIPGYAKARYEQLWESINGAGSWEANPWVWVIEFRRIERNLS